MVSKIFLCYFSAVLAPDENICIAGGGRWKERIHKPLGRTAKQPLPSPINVIVTSRKTIVLVIFQSVRGCVQWIQTGFMVLALPLGCFFHVIHRKYCNVVQTILYTSVLMSFSESYTRVEHSNGLHYKMLCQGRISCWYPPSTPLFRGGHKLLATMKSLLKIAMKHLRVLRTTKSPMITGDGLCHLCFALRWFCQDYSVKQ